MILGQGQHRVGMGDTWMHVMPMILPTPFALSRERHLANILDTGSRNNVIRPQQCREAQGI